MRKVKATTKTKLHAIVSSAASFLLLAVPMQAKVPGIPEGTTGATKGIVAVSHPAAAQVGKDILQQGGNAVDAAAGIQLALNVVEPQMSGIGGGGFMMIYLKKEGKITVIDSREMAPKAVDPKLFLDKDGKPVPFEERHTNGKAVGVPGTLLGLDTALKKYGTMKLGEVIDPAIALAEKGVPVNWITAQHIADSAEKLQKHGTAGRVFVPDGKALKPGELLIQPELAKTFKLIKEKGTDALYKGEIGEALVKEVQRTGGAMTMQDLKNYVVKEREPVKGTFRGYEVVSMAPPSSGGLTLIQILKLMEGFDNKKDGPLSAAYLHRLIEANHLAYADRAAYMADEDFYPVPKKGLIHDEYISERRKLINPEKASSDVKAGDPWRYEGKKAVKAMSQVEVSPVKQTTHFAVMDKWGNLVSYTTTIEDVFGSGIMVPGYGFMLNNELTDFDAVPGGVNQVEPGKRPRSSMTPTIVLKDGKPFMAVGSPGGSTIIASVSQTILNVLEHDMPIQEAILSPRIFSSSYPTVSWEAGIDQDVILQLMGMGHAFKEQPENIGNVQAIIYDLENGRMYGGADNTREGTVLGVDAVAYTSAEPPAPKESPKAAFQIKVNGNLYPYTADQLAWYKGEPYVQADKLLLGLHAKPGSFQSEQAFIDGRAFLPVKKVAEGLGFTVTWDAKEKVVSLQKQ
ncbi:gamma-glutamyltransferase [Brevibacillus borstelensis]|uniref:gamma-glutamyltransferase n=1 Tax=Brevibacillus borstelensis TaxID=45462 RepID=UPI003D8126D7